MRIRSVLTEPALSGFDRDDQAAIRSGAGPDGFLYVRAPFTPGFSEVREAGAAVTVLLVLKDGQVVVGDCPEVQYSGAGGRAPVFAFERALTEVRDHLAPFLTGLTVDRFRDFAEEVDRMVVHDRPLLTGGPVRHLPGAAARRCVRPMRSNKPSPTRRPPPAA